MKSLNILNLKGDVVGTIESDIFEVEINHKLISSVLRYGALHQRTSTAQTKNRSRVAGSGRKRIQQKRTGNARMGERNPVHHRGGCVSFGPNGRLYKLSLNKKVRQKALAMILSEKLLNNKFIIIDKFEMDSHKTKDFKNVLNNIKIESKAVFVDTNENIAMVNKVESKTPLVNFGLAMGNLFQYKLKSIDTMHIFGIIHADNFVITKEAFMKLHERLGGSNE